MKFKKLLGIVLSCAFLSINAVDWHNLSDTACPGPTNNGIQDGVQAAPVIDDNISLMGVNSLVGGVHVSAVAVDIAINVNSDSVLTGSGDRCDGLASAPAQLYLNAAAGRTITFNVNNNLSFRGARSASNGAILDLLVVVQGAGTVIFNFGNDRTVTLNSSPNHGGTKFFIGSDGANNPTLRFQRQNTNTAQNVNLVIGARSLLSFMSSNSAGITTMEFNNTNQGLGMLNVTLQDTGAFLTVSHAVSTMVNPTLANINMAGTLGQANLNITSPSVVGASSITRVINQNTVYPSLRANPFCDMVFTGTNQFGFILGPTGTLNINNLSYLDYIGTATNLCVNACSIDPECPALEVPAGPLRNPSAFIVDGSDCVTTATSVVAINFLGVSGLYFRSGVDACGNVSPDFTIDPLFATPYAGNIVFDIEGELEITGVRDGAGAVQSGFNVLSLQVTPTGCPVLVERTENVFPQRTFARNAAGQYLQYNKGAILVNNRVNITDTVLIHTDEIHTIGEPCSGACPQCPSDPTYVGGSTYFECQRLTGRPRFKFINAQFRVHTSVASTGVDFLVGYNTTGNLSEFIFYNNGRCIDQGYGRNWILGTCCGDLCCTTSDTDSHLNVFQDEAGAASTIQLNLLTSVNTNCITEGIPSNPALIANQCAVQTIFLANQSNISIGTLGSSGYDTCTGPFALTTPAQLVIASSCFSFETQGGCACLPESADVTGQGGMFVDTNGTVRTLNFGITNMGMMVVRSGNGVVDLPTRSVFFDNRVGIANWNIDLSDPNQAVVVPANQSLSEFNLDWPAITKNYCCTNDLTATCFAPYELCSTPTICQCPAVTFQNLTSLPTVQGRVAQFNVVGSRICDQVHLNVDGGTIDELIFYPGCQSAVAPVGFIVIQNNGSVGIGSAHRNTDSLDASIKLGINGVMLVANGDGCVELNEDILIDNECHILSGTAFGVSGENRLRIFSTTPKELRIKSTGSLDLSQFNTTNKVLEIGGQVRVVAEPGARIIMNGGILNFTDESILELERVCNLALFAGTTPSSTDAVRVRLSGSGAVIFNEDARMVVPQGSAFGVETFCTPITDITMLLQDQASIEVGTEESPGGAFQIGDTTARGGSITFQLILDGRGTLFQVDRQGFFGMGVGIVNKFSTIPNNWTEANLDGITSISITILEGTIRHDQIRTGFDNLASLWAIGNQGLYSFVFAQPISAIRAGGNLAKVNSATFTPVNIIVDTTSGIVGQTQVGIMAGRYLLLDSTKGAQPVGVTPQALYNYLATDPYTVPSSPRANAASDQLNILRIGYVRGVPPAIAGTFIRRLDINQGKLLSFEGALTNSIENSIKIGAVEVTIEQLSGDEGKLQEILGAAVQ